jgi:ribonuclease HII
VKGDDLYLSIAAASILAKTARDEMMAELHLQFPHYGWSQNKGYPTQGHIQAIMRNGYTPLHRTSFQLHGQLRLYF